METVSINAMCKWAFSLYHPLAPATECVTLGSFGANTKETVRQQFVSDNTILALY
jgi:hypothetical protein